jgi:hypothetical protein
VQQASPISLGSLLASAQQHVTMHELFTMLYIAVLVRGRNQQSRAEVSCGKCPAADTEQGWLAAATA